MDFTGRTAEDATIHLKDFNGQYLILYFYPKDNTSGCSQQAQDFRDHYAEFQTLNTAIVGVSRDSFKSHANFTAKFKIPFPLISDTDETLCNAFNVIKEKSLYGRQYLGIERSTFLFDPKGKLIKEWRKVKVRTHVSDVLEHLKEINT